MPRVFLMDDEPFYHKLLAPVLKKAGYELEYARTPGEGLARLSVYNPDVIILDVRMPDMSGYQILERLRRDPHFSLTPVMFVTGQHDLEEKLKAFDLGVDDYLEKPFEPEELVARLGILMRRGQALRAVQKIDSKPVESATIIAVHSLRGGSGVSSLAVNLALAFYNIWLKPTVLVDAVLAAGQVAMMLDATPSLTWEDFMDLPPTSIDDEMVERLVQKHSSGIQYVASPKFPIAPDAFSPEFWSQVIDKLRSHNDFIVIDTTHDFSDLTIQMLNLATQVVLVVSPEMASLRAAISALNIYEKLGYTRDKIQIALNISDNNTGIRPAQIDKVIGYPMTYSLPYAPSEVNRALNFGEPFLLKNPDVPISLEIEKMAYQLSNEIHKNLPPPMPTQAWKRVTARGATRK